MSQSPPPLRAESRALLERYRSERGMPTDVRARLDARLRQDHAGQEPPAAARSSASRWGWAALGGAVAAAVVAGLVVRGDRLAFEQTNARRNEAQLEAGRSSVVGTVHDRAPTSPARAPTRSPPPAAPRPATKPVAPSGSPSAMPQDRLSPRAAAPDPVAIPRMQRSERPRPSVAPLPQPPPETTDPSPSTLGEENRLISAAWRHVTAKALSKAKAVIDEHERRFATGVLAPERRALRVIVGCLGGSPGSTAAEGFAARHPRSPLLKKVREACGPRELAPQNVPPEKIRPQK